MTRSDKDRIDTKRAIVAERIREMAPVIDNMLGLLDETKLDLLMLALGLGVVVSRDE